MSLRHLARQFKSPGTLAGFWQGSSVLAPQVQEHQRQMQAGQTWPGFEHHPLAQQWQQAANHDKDAQDWASAAFSGVTDHVFWEANVPAAQPEAELSRTSTGFSETGSSSACETVDTAQPLSSLSVNSVQAQEHITDLLDEGSFIPVTPFAEDMADSASQLESDEAVITGRGQIDGRPVAIVSQIPIAADGCLSDRHSQQICHLMDHAMEAGVPIVSLHDTSRESTSSPRAPTVPATPHSPASTASSSSLHSSSLAGFTDVLQRHAEASGVVPQLALSIGRCSMDACMGFALSDFALTVDERRRPARASWQAEQANLGQAPDKEGEEHAYAVDWAAMLPNRKEALAHMRDLLSYLPLSSQLPPPKILCSDPEDRFCPDLDCLIPDDQDAPYEVREVICTVADDGRWHEVAPHSARNIVTGFGRLGGASVGIVANAPGVLTGCLDAAAATKAARFVRFCDAFNVPIVTLVDAPGFLVPAGEGGAHAVRQAAQLLYAYSEASVPKLTVILRMAQGSAYGIMSSKHLRADVNLAWPSAKIAVRGADGTRQLIFSAHDSLFAAAPAGPDGAAEAPRIARPLAAAPFGIVDAVIRPAMTRRHLCSELALLQVVPPSSQAREAGKAAA